MINFIIECVKHRDINGNTYFASIITRTSDGEQLKQKDLVYGYGNQFMHEASKSMNAAGWIQGKLNYSECYVTERYSTKKEAKSILAN